MQMDQTWLQVYGSGSAVTKARLSPSGEKNGWNDVLPPTVVTSFVAVFNRPTPTPTQSFAYGLGKYVYATCVPPLDTSNCESNGQQETVHA